ncbi:MAG: DUF1573 domain-containing protein [Ginsengibacter sp.]
MVKIGFILLTTCFLFSCDIRNSSKGNDVKVTDPHQPFKDSTTVTIIDSAYNFGKVTDGEKVEYNYRFINSGTKPLIISDARASCGCTVPEKPDAPIPPGQTGYLKVVFNSKGRVGDVHKEITVTSNAYPAFPALQLKGEVVPEPK